MTKQAHRVAIRQKFLIRSTNAETVMKTDVLIAEADAKLCGSYQRMFSGSGLCVETATTGLECWSKLRASTPDALMVDVDLLWGGSDGVLARLKENSDGTVCPEIFVTGIEPPEVLSRRAGIELGRCFQKPIHLITVLNSICEVFSSNPEITLSGGWLSR